jgi:hypothetical protein
VLAEPSGKRREARGRPAVEERRPVVGLEQVAADHALVTEVEQIERGDGHPAILVRGGAGAPPLTNEPYLSAQYAAELIIGHSRSGSAR